MRRILITVLPIVTLALFIFVMQSGNILKRPLGEDDNIPESIDDIIIAVNNDEWDEANGRLIGLENAWSKVVKRVQFSSERDEINMLSTSIARLRGAIEAEDKAGALMELYEAYNHWTQLGK
jgi:hypothetical protein